MSRIAVHCIGRERCGDMSNYLLLLAVALFVAGMLTGVAITYFGFKLGFKANFEARLLEDDVPDSKRLFRDRQEPAEFELLEKEQDDEDL